MTWKTSNYPADTQICPYCDKKISGQFDIHEVLCHPEMRNYPTEYLVWERQRNEDIRKKKKKK